MTSSDGPGVLFIFTDDAADLLALQADSYRAAVVDGRVAS